MVVGFIILPLELLVLVVLVEAAMRVRWVHLKTKLARGKMVERTLAVEEVVETCPTRTLQTVVTAVQV